MGSLYFFHLLYFYPLKLISHCCIPVFHNSTPCNSRGLACTNHIFTSRSYINTLQIAKRRILSMKNAQVKRQNLFEELRTRRSSPPLNLQMTSASCKKLPLSRRRRKNRPPRYKSPFLFRIPRPPAAVSWLDFTISHSYCAVFVTVHMTECLRGLFVYTSARKATGMIGILERVPCWSDWRDSWRVGLFCHIKSDYNIKRCFKGDENVFGSRMEKIINSLECLLVSNAW